MPDISERDVLDFLSTEKGWDAERAGKAVSAIYGLGNWSYEAIYLGFRAGFRCEYCCRDLLTSPDDYKLWERDHLIPQVAGGSDDLKNLVLACLLCNTKFKGQWQPSAGTRSAMIEQVKSHLDQKRARVEDELMVVRAAAGHQPGRDA